MGVESIFSARKTFWDGLGKQVIGTKSSKEAIQLAGLNWQVNSEPIFLGNGNQITNHYANVRSSDGSPLGIVGNKYKIVQNNEAFSFTDILLGEGVQYETAGSINGGRVIWLLARMPEPYKILGDDINTYLVFTNTHDGTGSVRVAVTNIRVICQNTLNMAIKKAKRIWSARHTGSITNKMDDAMETLQFANKYMEATKETFEELYKVKMNEFTLERTLSNIIPITKDMTERQINNQQMIRNDIRLRYKEAPDLKVLDHTGARFVQAVADTTSHMEPLRRTKNFEENRFKSTIDGNALLDKTIELLLAA